MYVQISIDKTKSQKEWKDLLLELDGGTLETVVIYFEVEKT